MKRKLRIIKGMNDAKSLEERRAVTKTLMETEFSELKKLIFNPVLQNHIIPFEQNQTILAQTPSWLIQKTNHCLENDDPLNFALYFYYKLL